jgi:hypothetical protein
MTDEERRYARARTHLIRWFPEANPDEKPDPLEVLTPSGWVKAHGGLARYLWAGRTDIDIEEAERLVSQACSSVPLDRARREGLGSVAAGSGIRWLISPPLRMGAPRKLALQRTSTAEGRFMKRLGDRVPERTQTEALSGWQRGRDRHASVESRSQTFLQAAGLTTTLVLANSALLWGDKAVKGTTGDVVAVALTLASAALVAAGIYGLFGSMRTFDRVAPSNIRRVIERAQEEDDEVARQKQVASIFLSQFRTSVVTDWKLARLKRATWLLVAGVAGVAVASIALVAQAL